MLSNRFSLEQSIGAGVFSAVALLAAYAAVQVTGWGLWRPLVNRSPQTVISSGPYRPGDVVKVEGTKCNRSGGDIAIEGTAYWESVDGSKRLVPLMDGAGVRSPGCETRTFDNGLPDDIDPGRWRLMGVETAIEGGRRQTVGWYSEDFEVIR